MLISDFDYELPDGRVARFPPAERDAARLLVWRGGGERGWRISKTVFRNIGEVLPPDCTLVFNDTRVVRARLAMFRPSGARIEILCLEPHEPADYERAFAARGVLADGSGGGCEWRAMIGNAKKWKSGPVEIRGEEGELLLRAWRKASQESGVKSQESATQHEIVKFEWEGGETFGELLERLGRVPIPPYLDRDTQEVDSQRYQTVYASVEGSVAAPTAGLHFTPELIDLITKPNTGRGAGARTLAGASERTSAGAGEQNRSGNAASGLLSRQIERVTLHVGAGTFLPVKSADALSHPMHSERFEVSRGTVERLAARLRAGGRIVAVGTTSVRTLESLAVMGWQLKSHTGQGGAPEGFGGDCAHERVKAAEAVLGWQLKSHTGRGGAAEAVMGWQLKSHTGQGGAPEGFGGDFAHERVSAAEAVLGWQLKSHTGQGEARAGFCARLLRLMRFARPSRRPKRSGRTSFAKKFSKSDTPFNAAPRYSLVALAARRVAALQRLRPSALSATGLASGLPKTHQPSAATREQSLAPEPLTVGQFAWREVPEDFGGAEALEALAGWMRGRGMERLRAQTRIMITPGYKFRVVGGLVTNFHQPKSTLLLLVSAFTGGRWREIYDYALAHGFRFLSYGDSSLLLP